jgi:hypothetical protein
MPPKQQPPTLKKIEIVSSESESESESQDEESQPIIETKSKINEQSKSIKQRENIESDSEEIIEKVIESKLDDMTLLINITKKEEKLLKELSDLHKDKMTLIKKFEKKKETQKPREPHKPLKTISPIIKNFIGCDNDAKYTFNDLKKEFGKKLIHCGNKQIITEQQLKELKLNDNSFKTQFELEEVIKDEMKSEVLEQLKDKKQKYYIIKFGKLSSIVSCVNK